MTPFISHAKTLEKLLNTLVKIPHVHAKWLNTLSFLENCGARKIAACEHPTLVKEEMLKHAAEEFRHAHHLKRQLEKITSIPMETYSLFYLLGGSSTLHYLTALDTRTSRYLKKQGLPKESIKEGAYLLVTYAIELRAEELYPLYENVLRKISSPISIKSILLEEKEHLKEMSRNLILFPQGFTHARAICEIESTLCKSWLENIGKNIEKE